MAGCVGEELLSTRSVHGRSLRLDMRGVKRAARQELGIERSAWGRGPVEDGAIRARIAFYREQARAVIQHNHRAVRAVAWALLRRGKLTGPEVEKIISQHKVV